VDAVRTPRVKICCIASEQEAWLAVRAGAAALGLVSAMPSGPGPIDEDLIARIAAVVPPGVDTFLLTCLQDADGIIRQQRRTRVSTLQLCDRLLSGTYEELRASMPGVRIVQVVHVTGPESLGEAVEVAPHVHALLLDSGRPSLAVRELGGTGRVHDWSVSRRIREQVPVPIYLAGGLTPENVGEAIRRVGAFGVDVCSGLRPGGRLDERRLLEFFTQVRRAGGEAARP
jgi:phosphoribosylanthranilate isomerase